MQVIKKIGDMEITLKEEIRMKHPLLFGTSAFPISFGGFMFVFAFIVHATATDPDSVTGLVSLVVGLGLILGFLGVVLFLYASKDQPGYLVSLDSLTTTFIPKTTHDADQVAICKVAKEYELKARELNDLAKGCK